MVLEKRIEAILFSVGDKISLEQLSKLTKEKDLDLIKKTLRILRDKYNKMDSPITLHEEGQFWKMNVREEHMTTIRKLVKRMELPKTLLETMAVIAWKAPVLQSQVIRVRTNKAYDHLDDLEERGFITRKKHGRSKMIQLTQKFYDYFEINKKGGLDRVFRRVTERAKKKYGKLEVVDESPEVEVVEEDQTGEKIDNLEVYEEKPEIEVIKENTVMGKELTPENQEKLKKAQELIDEQ